MRTQPVAPIWGPMLMEPPTNKADPTRSLFNFFKIYLWAINYEDVT